MSATVVCGYPGTLGGADTELWHVLRVWRRFGFDVGGIPTSQPSAEWRAKCDAISVYALDVTWPDGIDNVLESGTVVLSFCSGEFLKQAARFRELRCKIVWIGCMSWMFPAEREHYDEYGPFDAYVFQSEHQRSKLLPELRQYGVRDDQCFLIRGAFCPDEFPFAPRSHLNGSQFIVGRLARPDLDKWHEKTWAIYEGVPNRKARVMGWDSRIELKLGRPPEWAEALPPCTESSVDFLHSLHCLMPINGGAEENWPRVGLEAMSAGVPIIAENRWGWREMIDHGRTGFLANDEQEFVHYATLLASDEDLRLEIAHNARRSLESDLANPDTIWAGWKRLFDYVESLPTPTRSVSEARAHQGLCPVSRPSHHGETPPALDFDTTSARADDDAWAQFSRLDIAQMSLRQSYQHGFLAGMRYQSAIVEAQPCESA
jgi:hypothetical protein